MRQGTDTEGCWCNLQIRQGLKGIIANEKKKKIERNPIVYGQWPMIFKWERNGYQLDNLGVNYLKMPDNYLSLYRHASSTNFGHKS